MIPFQGGLFPQRGDRSAIIVHAIDAIESFTTVASPSNSVNESRRAGPGGVGGREQQIFAGAGQHGIPVPRAAAPRKIARKSARSPIGQLSVVDRSFRQPAAQVCDNATTGAVGEAATKPEHGEAARDQNLRALSR